MENNAQVRELVKLINDESLFIRKLLGMWGGFTFHILHITPEMVYITAKAERNQEHHENFIMSYINAMVNLLHEIVPVPKCQVMYYSNRNDLYPEFIRVYPFYRKSSLELKSNVIFIEEDVAPIREKIKQRCGNLFSKNCTGQDIHLN